MHFKKFYQALLFALACTIAGLLLLWGGATLYLKVAQNYTAASPADCVARIVMRNGKKMRDQIRRYGETLMEVPLTDELELKLVAATDRDGIDRTDSLLALEHVYLVTCFDMEASHPEGWEAVLRYLATRDTPVVVLANTDQGEAVERLGIPFPIYFTDPVTLKTILRSNPGVVELKRGVVVSKRSCFELENED